MTTIIMSGEKPNQLIVCNPDRHAKTGRWCAALPELYPDLCERCIEPGTMAHLSATAYVTQRGFTTEANPSGLWRHGRCRRCSRLPVMKPYRKDSMEPRAARLTDGLADPKRKTKEAIKRKQSQPARA